MRTQAIIKAKRAHDKAEAQNRLLAAREQFRTLPEIEKIDLRTCPMRELLSEIADSSLDAVVSDPLEECAYAELAELAARKLKPLGTLAVTCKQGNLPRALAEMSAHMRYRWTMVLMQNETTQVPEAGMSTSWKPVLVFGHGKKWMGDVPKDVEKLVDRLTQPAQLICDPYLGRGDIAAACVRLCRRIVGCDTDAKMVETARSRVALEMKAARPN